LAKQQISLRLVTPLFLNGSNSRGSPEWRAASVRGQLRYWLRAILGARLDDLSAIRDEECAVLGSTEGGSPVSLRLYGNRIPAVSRVAMLPHRANQQGHQEAILPPEQAMLEIVTRPGVPVPPRVMQALQVWLLLGGLGKRSRRMFGALDVRPIWGSVTTPDELATLVNERLTKIVVVKATGTTIPDFPTLHPLHSRVLVARQGFNTYEDAMRSLFNDLLRSSKYRPYERMFGHATRGRRASPLIAQVRQFGDQLYPVLTMVRSNPKPDEPRAKWQLYNDFFTDAQRLWNGVDVWGNPF